MEIVVIISALVTWVVTVLVAKMLVAAGHPYIGLASLTSGFVTTVASLILAKQHVAKE